MWRRTVVGALFTPAFASGGGHVCVPFETDGEQRRVVTSALVAGLEGGEKVVYVADSTPVDMVLDWLRQAGLDPRPYVNRGQLEVQAGAEEILVDGEFDPERTSRYLFLANERAAWQGYRGLRFAGEMTWTLHGGPCCDLLYDYEQRINSMVAAGQLPGMVAICQYDLRRFTPEQVDALQGVHSVVVRAPDLPGASDLEISDLEDRPGLRLSGEVDVTNFAGFEAAVRAAARPGQDVYLDMTDLRFVDVAAIRLVAKVADAMTGDCQVVVLSPPMMFRRVLEASGWSDLRGLRLEGRPPES
jgi:anti-anti-sigma factor